MNLVIYDNSWVLYQPLIQAALQTEWEIAVGANRPDWLYGAIRAADALVALRLPAEAREVATRLKMLHFPGAGVMHSDSEELPLGCSLCNVAEHEGPIAEYVMMVILMHVSGIRRSADAFRRGHWEGTGRVCGVPHDEAFGKRIALIGYGRIGREIARRAAAFGMRVSVIRRHPSARPGNVQLEALGGPADLPDQLSACDFAVVACPLTRETEGWITRSQLACLPPHAYLINVARAEIINERDLYETLRDGKIAGAALDVWYQYPDQLGDIAHGSRFPFHELPNVLVTPHYSAWTRPMVERRARKIAANLDRLARGEPLERVVLNGTWTPAAIEVTR